MTMQILWYLVTAKYNYSMWGIPGGLSALCLCHIVMHLQNHGLIPTKDLCNRSSLFFVWPFCISLCLLSPLPSIKYCHQINLLLKYTVFSISVCPRHFGHSILSGVAVSRGQTNMIDYCSILLVMLAYYIQGLIEWVLFGFYFFYWESLLRLLFNCSFNHIMQHTKTSPLPQVYIKTHRDATSCSALTPTSQHCCLPNTERRILCSTATV